MVPVGWSRHAYPYSLIRNTIPLSKYVEWNLVQSLLGGILLGGCPQVWPLQKSTLLLQIFWTGSSLRPPLNQLPNFPCHSQSSHHSRCPHQFLHKSKSQLRDTRAASLCFLWQAGPLSCHKCDQLDRKSSLVSLFFALYLLRVAIFLSWIWVKAGDPCL